MVDRTDGIRIEEVQRSQSQFDIKDGDRLEDIDITSEEEELIKETRHLEEVMKLQEEIVPKKKRAALRPRSTRRKKVYIEDDDLD